MKIFIAIFFLSSAFLACKETNQNESQDNNSGKIMTNDSSNKLSAAESIAFAHGFENWKNVNEISFSFNVDNNGSLLKRYWTWSPKSDDVQLISSTDTLSYNRNHIDYINIKTDRAFINDKYWFLAPYNLIWDEGTSFIEKDDVQAPISKDTVNQLTIMYNSEGGYTPGDAYDIYYGKDHIIKEWVFRKDNDSIPTMTLTWEDYKLINGLNLSTMHSDSTGNLKIYFTNISVK